MDQLAISSKHEKKVSEHLLKETWHEQHEWVVGIHHTSMASVSWSSSDPIGLCVRHVDEDIAEGVVVPHLRRIRCTVHAVTD
jgi:hypothetical protein